MPLELRNGAAALLIGLGTFFFLTGTLGILRMPDVFTRMHAAAKADSFGAGLWLLGAALICGSNAIAVKLVILTLFIWITGPTAAHIMARAAHRAAFGVDGRTADAYDPRSQADRHAGGGC
jgi:multicomponent Na+:H+ antiporter subunit G